MMRWWLMCVGLCAVSVLDRCASGEDAPPANKPAGPAVAMFGVSPQRNLVNLREHGLPTSWSIKEGQLQNIKWVAPLSAKAYGGPTVAGGKVFVGIDNRIPHDPKVTGDRGIMLCLRERDGRALWQAAYEPLPEEISREARVEGIASSPTVEGNLVYYVSNRGELICADAAGLGPNQSASDSKPGERSEAAPAAVPGQAHVLWRLDMVADLHVFPHKLPNGSPLIVGDRIYVCTGNGAEGEGGEARVPHPQAPSLIAVDKHAGKVLWQDNSPGANIILGQWSSPAYAVIHGRGQVIYGGGDGWLRGFDAESGKPIWKFNCNLKADAARGTPNYIVATPVVYENRAYIGVGQEPSQGTGPGHFWCIALDKTSDVSPAVDGSGGGNSALIWQYGGPAEGDRDTLFGRTLSTAAVHDGLVYISELAGFLHCLDARTGKQYWDHDLKAEIWGSPYWVDGKIYLGTQDGDVHIFRHGKEKQVLGKVEMEDPISSTPTAANGVLYVMTMKNLYAIGAK